MAAATQQARIQPDKVGVGVPAYQREQARHLAWGAPRSSTSAGSRIVISGKSWIILTLLPVDSSEFSELLKQQLTLQIDADPIITEMESMAAALNDCDIPVMILEVKVPLVIVCSPFEAGNEHPTMVNVWADPEKFELTRALADNVEFTVLDIRKPLSPTPRPLRMEVPLVTSLGHYLATTDCPGGVIIDSVIWGHVFGDEELVKDVKFYANPRMLRFHNGTVLLIVGVGSVETKTLKIPHVEYAPGLKVNLVAMNQLGHDNALFCCFNAKKFEIKMDNGTVIGAGALGEDGIYVLQHLKVPQPEEEMPSQLNAEKDPVPQPEEEMPSQLNAEKDLCTDAFLEQV
ncbi:hypothetical protein ACP4OV_001979 [Aristida adscensionis]